MSWETVQLGSIVDFKGGGTPDKSVNDYWNGHIPWASVKDFKSTELSRTVDTITQAGLDNSASNMIPRGTIIVPTRMAVGKAAITSVDLAINQDLKALIPKIDVDTRYLLHVLLAYRDKLLRFATGATVKGITLDVLRALEVPLPPPTEQQRIAAILDQADDARRLRRETITRINQIGESIYARLMEGASNSSVKLKRFADIQVGYPFKSNLYSPSSEGVSLCRGANVLPGEIDWSDHARYPAELANAHSEFALHEGDVVLAMDRPWISSGFKVARLSQSDLPALLVQRVARVRARRSLDRYFLYYLMKGKDFQRHCRPTETTVPHISPIEVREFLFPLPSDDQRERFEAEISVVAKLTEQAHQHLSNEDRLFTSLQHRAFNGEL